MIPKIICWIFGHKRYGEELKRIRKTDAPNTFIRDIMIIPLIECPRCGKPLK